MQPDDVGARAVYLDGAFGDQQDGWTRDRHVSVTGRSSTGRGRICRGRICRSVTDRLGQQEVVHRHIPGTHGETSRRQHCPGGEYRRRGWPRVENIEQLVHVDVFRRQPTAQHVVRRCHDLDADTVDIGVQQARGLEQCLARLERHVVEQQRRGDPHITGVCRGEAAHQVGGCRHIRVHGWSQRGGGLDQTAGEGMRLFGRHRQQRAQNRRGSGGRVRVQRRERGSQWRVTEATHHGEGP